MKTSLTCFLCLFVFLFGFHNPVSAQSISGEQGYKINHDIRQCPEFMIKLFLDLSAYQKPNVSKITFDVEYNTADFQPKTSLPFTMYAQGTRYPDVSFRTDDKLGPEEPELEARIKWWTFSNNVLMQPEHEIINVTFFVGKGAPISWPEKFNFVQLYFKFLKAGAFKIGDRFPIHIRKLRIYQLGSSDFSTSPDFTVYIKIESLTSVAELPLLSKSLIISPNPAKDQVSVSFSLAEDYNQDLTILISNSLGYQQSYPVTFSASGIYQSIIDVSKLNSGFYWLSLANKQKRSLAQSLIIIR